MYSQSRCVGKDSHLFKQGWLLSKMLRCLKWIVLVQMSCIQTNIYCKSDYTLEKPLPFIIIQSSFYIKLFNGTVQINPSSPSKKSSSCRDFQKRRVSNYRFLLALVFQASTKPICQKFNYDLIYYAKRPQIYHPVSVPS